VKCRSSYFIVVKSMALQRCGEKINATRFGRD